ncbi:MAG: rod shape-determining protein MreC [Candidatus Levybacteria bacterium]|nr:rod shape-determining protein MreC [Candidatus Levybacteria bacterium]
MPKRSFFPAFLVLIVLSGLFIVLSKTGILSVPADLITKIVSPLQRATFNLSSGGNKESKLSLENKALISKLTQMQKLLAENSALRDQFETSVPKSQNLLPASIVSAPSFVPGVTPAEYLTIDKGSSDGVKIGSAVVFKDNLVGKVTQVSNSLSKVILVSNSSSTFPAKTISIKGERGIGALGVVSGLSGQDLILDKVLLSDTLQVGDYVVTKGDLQVDNTGYPPSLIVGKIISVEKKASELFQRAKVKSLLEFSKLTTVFVVLGYE